MKRLQEEIADLEEAVKNKPIRPDDTETKAEVVRFFFLTKWLINNCNIYIFNKKTQLQGQLRGFKRTVDHLQREQTHHKNESDRLEADIKDVEKE